MFDHIKDAIESLAGLKGSQIWAVIILIAAGVYCTWWVENRYAKIVEIEAEFEQNRQQLDTAHFMALELYGLLSEAQRKQIAEKLEVAERNRDKRLRH